jgi:hypothetical protein
MPPIRYSVRIVEGLQASERRAVAFLECPSDASIDASRIFDRLDITKERQIRIRFDHWIGNGTNPKWFHGFPNDLEHKECFTFKWKENRQHHRFYGFLSHARPLEEPRFQVCVLVYHAVKNTWDTDPTILDRCRWRRQDVGSAIVTAFRKERSE